MEALLSEEEREAETIFMLTIHHLIDKELFLYMVNHLGQRNQLATCYLHWLIVRYIASKYKNVKNEIKIFNYI